MLYGLVSDVKKQNAELKVQLNEVIDQSRNATTELKAQNAELKVQNTELKVQFEEVMKNVTLKLNQRESCFARRSQE